MSQENVEIVRRWFEAYNRRDIGGLTDLSDPEIDLRSRFVAIEPVLHGYEGIRAYFEGLHEAYDHFEVVPVEFIDAGAAVVVVGHADWRGKRTLRRPGRRASHARGRRFETRRAHCSRKHTLRNTARTMSQENVEIVRRMYELWGNEDWDGMVGLVDPDIEQHGTIGGLGEGHVSRGVDQIRQRYEDENIEVWDEHRMEPERFIDAGERVVVLQHEYQRGRGSGVEIEIDTATVFDLRGGRIVRIQPYMDPAAALKAVGLSK
jgi:ketosteroid isomerase-like protein